MRRLKRILLVMILATSPVWPVACSSVAADTANAPSLVISQLKITSSNGQFVTLYNPTNTTLDMSKYQLEYFNNYDLTKATSSRLIALSGTVPPHGYYMVNDSAMLLCYQLSVNSVSLSFSSTAGLVEVLAFNQAAGGSVTQTVQDYVGWSKTAVVGAQTLPSNTNAWLQRQPVDAQYNPLVISAGVATWLAVQPDPNHPCSLVSSSNTSVQVLTGLNQLLPSTEPPATILSGDAVAGDITAPAGMPESDIGLMVPQVNELLPNPDGTGNDGTKEFIELYNGNDSAFDLSGFSLQVGLTTTHKYTFPVGTSLPPKTFKAFYSSQTGLSLSNIGGQTKLLDPYGNSVSASDNYGSAKDGQAWALANGKWYWTTVPTPGAANIIKQDSGSTKSAAKKSASVSKKAAAKAATKVKAAKKAKTKKAKKPKKLKTATNAAVHQDTPTTTPIHPKVLAAIGGLGLLYLAYEYRTDIANKLYQYRRYFRNRRGDRPEA